MQKKRKFKLKPQTLMDTARWRISPEAKGKMDEYIKWLEKKKHELEKRKNEVWANARIDTRGN